MKLKVNMEFKKENKIQMMIQIIKMNYEFYIYFLKFTKKGQKLKNSHELEHLQTGIQIFRFKTNLIHINSII